MINRFFQGLEKEITIITKGYFGHGLEIVLNLEITIKISN